MAPTVDVAPFGGHSVLITVGTDVDVPALAHAIRSEFQHLVIRLGLESVLATGEDLPDTATVHRLLSLLAGDSEAGGHHHVVPVIYDGQDLHEVAKTLMLDVEELVSLHTGMQWRVAMLGFAPGFPYLRPVAGTVHPFDRMPRLSSPRVQVPSGSVAIAAGMSCIYPNALPGGWRLLGRTQVRLFDANDVVRPALMQAGDLVQFTVAT